MKRCPWSGNECDCTSFPWKVNDIIPTKCEADLPIEMAGVRSVTKELKEKYRLYIIPCKRCGHRFEKPDRSVKFCERCQNK